MAEFKEPFYDVLTLDGNTYKSSFFTFKDFINILKKSFMSYDDFVRACETKLSDRTIKDLYINNISKYYDYKKFDKNTAAQLKKVILNENRLQYTNFFRYKVLNFASNKEIRFDFYINGESSLLLSPPEEHNVIVHPNPGIPKGMLICRVYNYSNKRGSPTPEFSDESLCISEEGIYDSQNRAFTFLLDEYVSNYELDLQGNDQYVQSPFLGHCNRIYDKILLSSKQRDAYFHSIFLKNAVDATYNDARIVDGMNDKYKRLQEHYVRVIPVLNKTINETEIISDRFFPFCEQQFSQNIYSYADVISGGSGDSSSNKISIEDYQIALNNLGISDMVFTKEENTSSGLFSWIDPGFISLVEKYNNRFNKDYKSKEFIEDSPLNNHMFTIDYENRSYITAIRGEQPEKPELKKDREVWGLKVNQRMKLCYGRTYLFETQDHFDEKIVKKELGNTGLSFMRDFDYFTKNRTVNHVDHSRNALVAFVSSDIELPAVSTLVDLSIQDLNKWMYSLRGVACEGFFTKDFLSQRMILKRTRRLKCSLDDCTNDFKDIVKNLDDYVGKLFLNDDKDLFVYRTYLDCQCSGRIISGECRSCNNPKPVSFQENKEYWVDFNKGFDFVSIRNIKMVEDGINVYLDYSIPLANARVKNDELMKSVTVESSPKDIGYIIDLECGDLSFKNANIQLDGVFYGLGGFKSGIYGIPFTGLRLYNALKNKVVFNADDCIYDTDKVNEFLKTFKKSKIKTKMYDKESGTYKHKVVDAWVGMINVEPTEASQEFNKVRGEDERSFSKINYSLFGSLGFHDLNTALAKESAIINSQHSEMMHHLFKIARIHSSFRPLKQDTAKQKDLATKHDQLVKELGVKKLVNEYLSDNDLFSIGAFDKYSLKTYITLAEYRELIELYPLFNKDIFTNGFYIHCSLGLTKEQNALYKDVGEVDQTIYFPPKSVLMSMFEKVGENNVRINGLLGAYISVFESLAVSKYGNSGGQYISNFQLVNKNKKEIFRSFNDMNGKILSKTQDLLFGKEGLLNQATNIAVPRIMSKQLTSINCPYDVAIVGKNKDYKEVASKILKELYPDEVQDWSTPTYDKVTGISTEPGWCWLRDIYGFAVREPNLFSKQNLNVKQIWSSYRADIEFKKMYGVSFHQMHPGSKGIHLNPVFAVFNLEGDVDGDNIYLGMPYTANAQKELAKVYEKIKNNAFFDKENKDPIANLVRDTYLVPSLDYLVKEAKSLNFELDSLKIGYSTFSFGESLTCNFTASEKKTDVGPLTTSLWAISYFITFYVSNYKKFVEKGYGAPELTLKNQYELKFIFEYLLAQQNGVRAMKSDGSYSKITLDSLITNKQFSKNESSARVLLTQLVNDYKKDNEKNKIIIDFSDSVKKLFDILDYVFISTGPYKGFGFALDYNGKAFKYSNSRWTYGEKAEKPGKHYYNCSNKYDPLFIDFQGSYLLLFGRDPDSFINKFGYQKTLQFLEFENKPHMHTEFLSLLKDVFNK